MNGDVLERLCRVVGIAPAYADIWGGTHVATAETRRALLQAMHVLNGGSDMARALEREEAREWLRVAPPVTVCRETSLPYRIVLTFAETAADHPCAWRLALEDGGSRQGEFRPRQLERLESRAVDGEQRIRVAFDWRETLPAGYHRFVLQPRAASPAVTTLVIAPGRCYLPPALSGSGRTWGVAAQLYGLRSARGWGMGDFTDLVTLAAQWGERGVGVVGVNPLHALYPHNPAHASPYGPSSRRFLNVLYLDVEAVEDLQECADAQQEIRSAIFQESLKAARESVLVDYPAVAQLKFRVLERLYDHFVERHLNPRTARARAFREFQEAGGNALRQHALYEALQQHFHDADGSVRGFPDWPAPYRDPDSEAVARFADAHSARVELYEYLQWQADLQLGNAAERCRRVGMEVGLYTDIAVSIDAAGAESWANQDCYTAGATLGAPPDEINRDGQNWGLPPLHPVRLREAAYAPFIAVLRAGMRHAGAVRIDHVMGLARLFWIPRGGSAADGAYVHYPFEDLLGVLALESHRHRCMVIGEDLGTVPDEVRSGLARTGVLSYRLLLFERDSAGEFKLPAEYPLDALVTATTHDLPTLAGFWEGHDLHLRHLLGQFADAGLAVALADRAEDRVRILRALERERLAPGVTPNAATARKVTDDVALAVQVYLARAPSRVQVVQLEDVFGVSQQANLPGTVEDHPNWRRKLPLALEKMPEDPRMAALAAVLSAERPRSAAAEERRAVPTAQIPRATYRLQLNRDFTFIDATALLPYLAELGVSHVYCSPYLRARPGSMHGYDIVDHGALNPEIGTAAEFEAFVAALRAHGMGHLLDMVPNHVGVMGADNRWWLDVLEHGPASKHATRFDIEWRSPSSTLANKVLVPALGEHYGVVLDRGELELRFDPAEGSFSAWYHEHRFPLDPRDYAQVLERALRAVRGADAAMKQLASIAAACDRLPGREQTVPTRVLERRRGAESCKERLVRLAAAEPAVATALRSAVDEYNGASGREALHELLERQAYRLTYWRVASDEINYRRFFDINDLAALRVEDEAVFEATHRFVLELAAGGKVDGLRIDHPDGLYDPAAYFSRLQQRYAQLCAGGMTDVPADRAALPLYLLAEKIIAAHEDLPENWAVHGTTGYRFAAVVNGLFVDGSAREEMERIYQAFAPDAPSFERAAYEGRHTILRSTLASALTMLVTELLHIARADRSTRDYTLNTLRRALAEVVACFPVYRTYIAGGKVTEQDRRYIDWAVARARRRARAADASIFSFVRRVLLAEIPPNSSPELAAMTWDFAMRFQQLTAPVAAKGVEDTAFYRYHRLVSLNDVGSDPATFGMPVSAFHGASAGRAAHWPHTLLATSTHDNKRSEDVRARIDVLSEMPAAWQAMTQRWARMNRARKRTVDDEPAPSANDEYLLYQTLVGTLPADGARGDTLAGYRERIKAYMQKAIREAKERSSWVAVNEEYEAAVAAFVDELLDNGDGNRFLASLRAEQIPVAWFGSLNSLSMTLIKLASPGVPDIYQGNELIDLSLVDPDNRRAVDYELRRQLLRELSQISPGTDAAAALIAMAAAPQDGRAKLWIASRTLRLRASLPELFESGDYVPLEATGARAANVVAFARRHADVGLIVVAGRLWASLAPAGTAPLGKAAWGDTAVNLAPLGAIAQPVDVLGMGQPVIHVDALPLADAFSIFPAALILFRLQRPRAVQSGRRPAPMNHK